MSFMNRAAKKAGSLAGSAGNFIKANGAGASIGMMAGSIIGKPVGGLAAMNMVDRNEDGSYPLGKKILAGGAGMIGGAVAGMGLGAMAGAGAQSALRHGKSAMKSNKAFNAIKSTLGR